MIQMLDPPGVWGLSRRGLHFLLKNRRNKRKDIKKGAFSIARHRNLRGLDLVCINANFSVKNVILKRMKTVRGRIDANPDSEEKPKNEKRKIRARPVQHHKQSSQPSQSASKSASQKTVKPTTSKQSAAHHHNTATQQANHPADQLAETSQPKASSSNHPVSQQAIEPTQPRAP